MYKSSDFIYMDVVNIEGETLGYINDILINFHKKQILGFSVTPYKLLRKNFNVLKEDIIYHNKNMVVKSINKGKYLKFSDIKKIYVINKNSEVIGIVKDIIFEEKEFKLKGIVVAKNISSLLKERNIFIAKEMILGEKNMFYIGENKKFQLVCVPGTKKNIKKFCSI
ncbi:PRC-barrel domain-containing protein [Clostridium senegalense]|uniref:PRC-barrel domain-containing protein n=1 Tax=Clostridium senegalense TaxID=1465809 RepID=UPI001C1014AF|nr:PRC-barrel domain-containing protein [Clostridium senegalense]MBU5225656.1 PRC-barrel domain-containing protein [Clostridium senegalense]